MATTKISEVTKFLESIAPRALQESYDNSGLLTGDSGWGVTGVLVTLDCLEETLDEAIRLKCNLVVAHHPIIFKGLKTLTGKSYVERTVIKAIKNDIAIYAIHTNLDNISNGVNRKIAERIGLVNLRVLLLKDLSEEVASLSQAEPRNRVVGSGALGELPDALEPMEFLRRLKLSMKTSCVRYTALGKSPIRKVAVCGGAGSFLLAKAIESGADAFVSADFKYHEFFDADGKILVADIGHYESEQFTKDLLQEVLKEKFANFAVNFSETVSNPISYL